MQNIDSDKVGDIIAQALKVQDKRLNMMGEEDLVEIAGELDITPDDVNAALDEFRKQERLRKRKRMSVVIAVGILAVIFTHWLIHRPLVQTGDTRNLEQGIYEIENKKLFQKDKIRLAVLPFVNQTADHHLRTHFESEG